MGKEYDRIKRYKQHKYQKDGYVSGYVPGEEIRDIQNIDGDIIISNPIITERVIRHTETNYIQRITPIDTMADGDKASLDVIDKAPIPSTSVLIALNGRVIVPADGPGDTTAAAWFESPNGLVIRAQGAVQIGDVLKWNGSNAGTEVFSTDELFLVYQVDSL